MLSPELDISESVTLLVYFQYLFLFIDDEYIEPNKTMKYRDYNPNKSMQVHGNNWKPNGMNSTE